MAAAACPVVEFGAEDPLVRGYIERVCALTPAEWDRLATAGGASASAEALRLVRRHPVLGALQSFQWLSMRRAMAPLWRWWGTGPFRRLGEVLERPYVTPLARMWVYTGLMALRYRALREPDLLIQLYEHVEPVIPWASLGEEPPWAGRQDSPIRSHV